MDANGLNLTRLTDNSRNDLEPRWSPDDTWLLFTVQGTGENDYDVGAVRLADGQLRPVIVTPDDEREGDWAPARRDTGGN